MFKQVLLIVSGSIIQQSGTQSYKMYALQLKLDFDQDQAIAYPLFFYFYYYES
jgi:hypothetical protein